MRTRNYNFDIDKHSLIKPVVIIRSGDHDIDTIRITLSEQGDPVDLTKATVTFMGTTPAGNKIIDDAHVKIIDATTGIFEYTFPAAAGASVGEYQDAYFSIIMGNGQTSTMNFRIQVLSGVDISAPAASDYVTNFNTMVANLNSAYDSATAATNTKMAATVSSVATSAATVLNSALSNVANVNSQANNASSTANIAVSMASSVASAVTSQASYINSVASSAATDVNRALDKLNNLSIGGRNLMLGSADFSGGSSRWTALATVTTDRYRGTLISSSSAGYGRPSYTIQNAGILQVGKTYTFSIYARNTSDTDAIVARDYNANIVTPASYEMKLPAHTDWTRVSSTFTVKNDPNTSTDGLRWNTHNSVTNGTVQFAGYKLEEGNVATDWTPAPEDVDNKLSTRNATFTDFNDVARNMVKYSGSWVIAAQSIANSPLENYYTAKITPGFTGGTDGYIELVPFANGQAKKYIAVVGSGTLSAWKLFAFDDDVVHKTGNETVAGDKTLTGNTTLANIKSSSIKTANVTMGLLTLHFQQTVVGVNVYVDGTWSGTFSMSDSYISSGISIPSVISKPQLPVILNIISNGGIGGVTTNSPLKLELLIDTDGVIKYRAKTLRDNDTTARNSSIVGADSTFYAVG